MKKIVLILCILCTLMSANAQRKAKIKKRFIKSWHISEQLALADTVPMDTAKLNFQDSNPVESFSIANSYNANLGSPLQTKIYMKRPQGSDFIFEDAYKPYIADMSSALFYDTTFPYTNLTYLTGGPTEQKEEQVKFIYTISPSKKANFGTDLDYLYSVGRYDITYKTQAAKRFSGSIFGRYSGKHYSAYGFASMNNHANYESGGWQDIASLSDPNSEIKPENLQPFIIGYSVFRKKTIYLNQNYSIGFNKEVKINKDSSAVEYIPVTRFGHTIKYEEMNKRYYEPKVEQKFYESTYIPKKTFTNDTAAVRTLSNVLSVNLAEEFNRLMKFGLTGFIESEIQQFTYKPDTTIMHTTKSNIRVGGMLSKNLGTKFRYNIQGDIFVIGYKLGEFHLDGKAEGKFNIGKEEIGLSAYAFIRNEQPSFFLQNYYSNHFKWENSFIKMYKTHLEGTFSLPKRKTQLNVAVENVSNYIYFNEKALPVQYKNNIQVISVNLKQDLSFGHFTFENNAVYQLSSQQEILPLPMLSIFSNLYYHAKWFKDLYPQIGVSMRYHTNYYAPSYMPATGQFYNQKEVLIGNYPVFNVYANFHLKQARLFIEYNYWNKYFMKDYSMLMPNYPVNPPMLKMGISWNFYN